MDSCKRVLCVLGCQLTLSNGMQKLGILMDVCLTQLSTKIKLIPYHDKCKSSSCVFTCNTTSMHLTKDNAASCFLTTCICKSPAVSEFTLHAIFPCFKLTKQILVFYIINLINALSTDNFIHLLLLFLQQRYRKKTWTKEQAS